MNEMKLSNFDKQKLNNLLQTVSQKLGVPPEQLRQDLQTGKFDTALQNMSAEDSSKLQQALKNPQMVEKLMSTPQAQALYKKLTGGK